MAGKKLKHVRAGDPVTADLWNRIVARIEPFSKLSVPMSGYLRLTSHPHGKALSLHVPQEVPARLSGSSSPYSWVALADATGGGYTDRVAGMTGGTSNAYEINGKSGLNGKTVLLQWTAAGDWRFQFVGFGTPGCEAGRICVTVQGSCGFDVTGATVTLKDADDNVIDTGVTSGSPAKVCFDLPAAGQYKVTSHVAGATDLTTTLIASCGIDNNVTLTYPPTQLARLKFTFYYNHATPESAECNVPHAGVVVSSGGPNPSTGVSDASGIAYLIIGPGTHVPTASFPRGRVFTFDSIRFGIDVAPCNTFNMMVVGVNRSTTFFQSSFSTEECSGEITVRDPDGLVCGTGTLELVANPPPGGASGVAYVELTPEVIDGTIKFDIVWPATAIMDASGVTSCASPIIISGTYPDPYPCSSPP